MSPISDILSKIISDSSDYCCLCFQTYEETYYNLHDEVILDTDNPEDIIIYKILSSVLGSHVLDSLFTENICQKCIELAISSYKFIETSRNNVQNILQNIDCLQNYTKNVTNIINCNKSLYLVLNTENNTICHIYDKKQRYKNNAEILKRFQEVYRKSPSVHNFVIRDIKSEADNATHNTCMKRSQNSNRGIQSVQFSNISMVYEEDSKNGQRCKICMKIYPNLTNLKEHYIRIHAPKNFKCLKCPQSFGAKWLLNQHDLDCHCSTAVCSQCGKTYANTKSLIQHEKSHEVQHICPMCGKVYKWKQGLERHIDLNCEKNSSKAGAKYCCDYCGKKYTQKTALSEHIRVEHENGKALICDWCGKKYGSISRLNNHIVTHTKEKNFKCNICDGKFVNKAALTYHTRLHTGEKPYKCNYCDISFLSASRRSQHTHRHHSQTDMECDICHGKFKGLYCLRRHRKRHFNTSSSLYQRNVTNVEQ